MTKQEIEKVANECADSFGSMEPCISKIKQDVAARAYVLGATMVNEQQPYTPSDMEAFTEWCSKNKWVYDWRERKWWSINSYVSKTTAQLREMWEKERKEATE